MHQMVYISSDRTGCGNPVCLKVFQCMSVDNAPDGCEHHLKICTPALLVLWFVLGKINFRWFARLLRGCSGKHHGELEQPLQLGNLLFYFYFKRSHQKKI